MMTSSSVRAPLILMPQPDPVTGQAMYALPDSGAPTCTQPTMRDLLPVEGGKIAGVPGSGTDLTLPTVRMAATWEDIARMLRTAEDGRPGVVDVELRPGGDLVLTGHEQPEQPLSQLPKGRMAWLPVS
jgi:hypothetical protein